MKIVVITNDALGARMAGPAIRASKIAGVLSKAGHNVTLFTTGSCEPFDAPYATKHGWTDELKLLEAWCDVVVFQGFVIDGQPWLIHTDKVMVVDLYDPFHLEQLELSREAAEHDVRVEVVASTVAVLNEQMARGDFFLCASEKQRDFWLGALAALGRVNPLTYDADPSLRSLIDVVPFGVDDEPARQVKHAIRGVVDGIGVDDDVLLWGGGVYNWFDPLTLIRAVDAVRDRRPNVRLYFLGMKHPNREVRQMRMATEAMALAGDLGLTGKHVFFNYDWVPYEQRADWLLDADIGVSTHLDHVETAFSFRTRMLDYLWAGLPIVCTAGDSMGELVAEHELGTAVPPGDVTALADALNALLGNDARRQTAAAAVRAIAPNFAWSSALAPIVSFCASPRRAPDLVDRETSGRLAAVARRAGRQRRGLAHAVASVRRHTRNGRPGDVMKMGVRRVAERFRARF
ncbi:MAG: glycosyltransferase [Actinobacteria bacterium]|nr:glycosyltransferase [Actinomycetota bacterium]